MDIQQLPSSATGRNTILRTIAVLGVIGASIGLTADIAVAEKAPQDPLCQLLSNCDEDGDDDSEPGDESDLDPDPTPGDEPSHPVGRPGVTVTTDVLGVGHEAAVGVDVDDDGLAFTPIVDTNSEAGGLVLGLHQGGVARIRTDDGLTVNVDADNVTKGSAGHLAVVDNETAICGIQVVVGGRRHHSCGQPGATSGSGDEALLDLDAAESVCGLHVAVLGDSSINCESDADSSRNGVTADLLDGDVFAALCGIEVAIIGNTSTNCGATRTTDVGACFGIARLCKSLVDIDGALGLCGLRLSVLGSTDTNCSALVHDDGGDDDEHGEHGEHGDDDGEGEHGEHGDDDGEGDGNDDGDDGEHGDDDGKGDGNDDIDDGDGENGDDDGEIGDDEGEGDGNDDESGGRHDFDESDDIDDIDDVDEIATDQSPRGFSGGAGDIDNGSGGLPLTGGSVALTLLLGTAMLLLGYGLRRSVARTWNASVPLDRST